MEKDVCFASATCPAVLHACNHMKRNAMQCHFSSQIGAARCNFFVDGLLVTVRVFQWLQCAISPWPPNMDLDIVTMSCAILAWTCMPASPGSNPKTYKYIFKLDVIELLHLHLKHYVAYALDHVGISSKGKVDMSAHQVPKIRSFISWRLCCSLCLRFGPWLRWILGPGFKCVHQC